MKGSRYGWGFLSVDTTRRAVRLLDALSGDFLTFRILLGLVLWPLVAANRPHDLWIMLDAISARLAPLLTGINQLFCSFGMADHIGLQKSSLTLRLVTNRYRASSTSTKPYSHPCPAQGTPHNRTI
jgi:hypothetical protein